jgi:uncharacterized protein YqeY
MTLKQQLSEMTKTAMKSGDKATLGFARSLHAAIRKREIDDRVDLDDAGVVKIIGSLLKQRQDSIEQFKQGGRLDLVEKEEAESRFLQGFMPAQLSESDVKRIIESAIESTQAHDVKDLGKVMKQVMPQLQGVADMKQVNQWIRERLAGA